MKFEYTNLLAVVAAAGVSAFCALGGAFHGALVAGRATPRHAANAPSAMVASAQAGVASNAVTAAEQFYRAVPTMVHPRELPVRSLDAYEALLERAVRKPKPSRLRLGDSDGARLVEGLLREGVMYANGLQPGFGEWTPAYAEMQRSRLASVVAHATHDTDLRSITDWPWLDIIEELPKAYQRRIWTANRIYTDEVSAGRVRKSFGVEPSSARARPDPQEIVRALPKVGSKAWKAMASRARADLARDGYAVVPTAQYLTPELRAAVKARMAEFTGVDSGDFDVLLRPNPTLYDAGPLPRPEDFQAFIAFDEWRGRLAAEIFGTAQSTVQRGARQLYQYSASAEPILPGMHIDSYALVMGTDFGEAGAVVYPDERIHEPTRALPYLQPSEGTRRVQPNAGDTLIILGDNAIQKPMPESFQRLIGAHAATAHGSKPGARARLLFLTGFEPK